VNGSRVPKSEKGSYIPGPGINLNFFGSSSKMVLLFPVENALFPEDLYFDYAIYPFLSHVLFLGV
jgi:hypothetical protein